jgi:DNA polymerase-3 subunit epsilon/CBS domain-containing protein
MNREPVMLSPSTLVSEAIRRMAEERLQAVLAGDPRSGRADGIFTQSDAIRAIAASGAAALEQKLEAAMTAPVQAMSPDAFVYRALARMQRLGVGQLPVEDASGRIVGIISLRDLGADEAAHAVVMGDRLSTAPTPRALATVRGDLPSLARRLLDEGVPAPEVSAVLSAELRELLARAAVLAEKRMEAEGAGRPPVGYALLALGRLGRAEALFDSDL